MLRGLQFTSSLSCGSWGCFSLYGELGRPFPAVPFLLKTLRGSRLRWAGPCLLL